MYFKQGTCQKGDRCKFSHDLAVERKAEKRNLYEDTRENDTMADWDEAKLDDVINQKHGEDNKKKKTTTEIVSYLFIKITSYQFHNLKNLFRSVNSFWNQSRKRLTVGSGTVQMVKNVSTNMLYHLASSLRVK